MSAGGASKERAAALTTVCQLASGGMGRVEIVVRAGEGASRLYAVKRLHPHYRRDPQFLAMFMDEARIASRIEHPNVVEVLEFDEDVRGPYLLMEYVEGLPLSALLRHYSKQPTLPPIQACVDIAAQTAEGLHAAHDLRGPDGKSFRLVHRDLTPQNVLLGFDGVVRVTDFGVAKALGRATRTATGILKGKYGYMSPEQLRFEDLDRRSDLFSLGVVLHELLTCRRLYGGKDGNESARRILREPPPDVRAVRDEVPDALAGLIEELLAKDRGGRPRSARSAAQRLEELLLDLRAAEPPLDLATYTQSTFADRRASQRRKIDTGLAILSRREASDSAFSPMPMAQFSTSTTSSHDESDSTTSADESGPFGSSTGSEVHSDALFDEPGNALVMHGNVLIHVRSGEMTVAVLEAFERRITRLARRHSRAAYLGVIESSATIPSREVRQKQKQLIQTQLEHTDARLAVVIIGNGVVAKLSRAVSRVLIPNHGNLSVVATVREACAFLDSYVEEEARGGLHEAVERAREAQTGH